MQYFQLYLILSTGLIDIFCTAMSWEERFPDMDIKFTTPQAKPFFKTLNQILHQTQNMSKQGRVIPYRCRAKMEALQNAIIFL